jgi:hypothetical protein
MKLNQPSTDKNERAKLYIQSDSEKATGSAIRLEDVEVYMRCMTYDNKIKRMGKKLT